MRGLAFESYRTVNSIKTTFSDTAVNEDTNAVDIILSTSELLKRWPKVTKAAENQRPNVSNTCSG